MSTKSNLNHEQEVLGSDDKEESGIIYISKSAQVL